MEDTYSSDQKISINPREIHGNWRAGWALDKHWEEKRPYRTELGESVYLLKYKNDRSKMPRIAETASQFLKEKFPIDGYSLHPYPKVIIPIPPSINRSFQPVTEIAQEIGKLLNLPVRTDYLTKIKQTVPLKESSRRRK